MLEVKAIKVECNDFVYFVGVAKAKELFKVAVISRAEDDPENGFQRVLGKTRANQIAEYLDNGNVIPGSIVLSSTEQRPKFDENKDVLKIDLGKEKLLVIDGQHRLYGSNLASTDVYLPFCIFYGLDKRMEVQYFLDINGHQIGVPKTLRLELQKFVAEEDSEDHLLRSLFEELDTNPKSPLSGRMSRTKSVAGKISHVSFQNGMKPILNRVPFSSFTTTQKKLVLINFFSALEVVLVDIFGDSKKMTNAAFFQAVMGAFTDVAHIVWNKFSSYKQECFQEVLEALASINWDEHQGTNNQAVKNLTASIIEVLSSKNIVKDDAF